MDILEKIYSSGLKLLYPLNLEETYKVIVDEAIKLVDADEGLIIFDQGGSLRVVYGSFPAAFSIKIRKKGFAYRAFKKNESFVVHTEQQFEELNPKAAKSYGLKSIVFVPLSNKGESVGVLAIRSYKKGKSLKKRDLRILKLFGSFASLAIRKTQLFDDVRQALETRDLFISMASHELKTPLTSVVGYFHLIKDKTEKQKPVPKKWMDDWEFEINRLKQLVEDFLEINRIKTGQLSYNWEEFIIRKLVARAISTFKINKPNRDVLLEDKLNSSSGKVIADRNKLMQVFLNILENAAKYSDPLTKINIKLEESNDFYLIKIQDQGQGISKEEIPLVFNGFYRGKKSQHEGMGLGLHLAKNIIDAHHGSIGIESKINKGTSVKIKLPKI